MTPPSQNAAVTRRAQDRARRVNIGALYAAKRRDYTTAAEAVENIDGAMGVAEVDDEFHAAFKVDADIARQLLGRLQADGAEFMAVREPDGVTFLFGGRSPNVTRQGVRTAHHFVLPGQKLADRGEWEAIPSGADLVAALDFQKAHELPRMPPWLEAWLGGADLPPPELVRPYASAHSVAQTSAPEILCCDTCYHQAGGECHHAPPQPVVDDGGNVTVFGWLKVRPTDWCGGSRARSTAPRSCAGCALFARERRAAWGTCRAGRPVAPTNNVGVPISRDGMWPTVRVAEFCGSFSAQIGEAA